MTSMREKMAKGMFDRYLLDRDGIRGTWNEEGKQRWLSIADVGLEALMVPTEGMIGHVDAFGHEGSCPTCGGGIPAWQAMIRAAKEGK